MQACGQPESGTRSSLSGMLSLLQILETAYHPWLTIFPEQKTQHVGLVSISRNRFQSVFVAVGTLFGVGIKETIILYHSIFIITSFFSFFCGGAGGSWTTSPFLEGRQ